MSGSAPALLRSGIEISFTPTEYYCTKLADMKVAMLGEAVQDAQRRAEEIAGQKRTQNRQPPLGQSGRLPDYRRLPDRNLRGRLLGHRFPRKEYQGCGDRRIRTELEHFNI